MEPINKAARIEKRAEPGEGDLAKINAQTLRELGAEEVFIFRIAAADTLVDRDYERFSQECLEGMAKLYVGKPVLTDHSWSAGKQLARVYDAEVEATAEGHRLVLRCFMPRTEDNRGTITAIEAGGTARGIGGGWPYNLPSAASAARIRPNGGASTSRGRCMRVKPAWWSWGSPATPLRFPLVAVPAQPKAGVIKAYGGETAAPDSDPAGMAPVNDMLWQDEALLELEKSDFDRRISRQ